MTTEKKGFTLLSSLMPKFYVPALEEKKGILTLLGVDEKRFIRAFDGLVLEVSDFESIKTATDFYLVETKTTEKHLPNLANNPEGFFFGLTANEEMLFEVLGERARLCLISVHPDSEQYFMAPWSVYKNMSMNKRVQYQIHIKNTEFKCIKCGVSNPPQAKFCMGCGEER